MTKNKVGFTLIELLVVVLIIGILTAIGLPQYQKAVLKSRYTAMMPIGKAIAEGNEVYYLEHGTYATTPTQLDISGQDVKYPDETQVSMSQEDDTTLDYVLVTNDGIANARYVVYQKHSPNFAGTTMCEAGDTRAEELCIALGGQELPGLVGNSSGIGDWKAYLLTGSLRNGDKFTMRGWTAAMLQALADEKCVGADACTQNMDTGTVIATKCGISRQMPVNSVPLGGTTTSRTTCQNTTYDTKGNEFSTYTACGRGGFAAGSPQTGCYPTEGGVSGFSNMAYEVTTNEDGNLVGSKLCTEYSSSVGCTSASFKKTILNENGEPTGHLLFDASCASGSVDLATYTCGVYKLRRVTDETSKVSNKIFCTGTVSVAGECNGSWVYESRPVTGFAEVGNIIETSTCENGVDWDTVTCL